MEHVRVLNNQYFTWNVNLKVFFHDNKWMPMGAKGFNKEWFRFGGPIEPIIDVSPINDRTEMDKWGD